MVTPKRRPRAEQRKTQSEQRAARRVDLLEIDPDSPEFMIEARRQAARLANSPTEAEDQAFIDSISMWPDDTNE